MVVSIGRKVWRSHKAFGPIQCYVQNETILSLEKYHLLVIELTRTSDLVFGFPFGKEAFRPHAQSHRESLECHASGRLTPRILQQLCNKNHAVTTIMIIRSLKHGSRPMNQHSMFHGGPACGRYS